ncbi:hypothetical protein J6590_012297 [Homalodisca vitripennis]|nr:hypothetical protein J6590_012297 [Homalodisca vitripennis]
MKYMTEVCHMLPFSNTSISVKAPLSKTPRGTRSDSHVKSLHQRPGGRETRRGILELSSCLGRHFSAVTAVLTDRPDAN